MYLIPSYGGHPIHRHPIAQLPPLFPTLTKVSSSIMATLTFPNYIALGIQVWYLDTNSSCTLDVGPIWSQYLYKLKVLPLCHFQNLHKPP